MSPKLRMCLVLSGALMFSSVAVQAQRHSPDGPPPFGAPMELMGFEGIHGGKIVKGAPFSATATSETTSTLQDGSVLHRTSQVSMYRDSQGRSRHEATFTGFGPLTASGGSKKMVMISDPVAGVHFMLDDAQKVAHKSPLHAHGGGAANAESAPEFAGKMQERMQQEEAAGLLCPLLAPDTTPCDAASTPPGEGAAPPNGPPVGNGVGCAFSSFHALIAVSRQSFAIASS